MLKKLTRKITKRHWSLEQHTFPIDALGSYGMTLGCGEERRWKDDDGLDPTAGKTRGEALESGLDPFADAGTVTNMQLNG